MVPHKTTAPSLAMVRAYAMLFRNFSYVNRLWPFDRESLFLAEVPQLIEALEDAQSTLQAKELKWTDEHQQLYVRLLNWSKWPELSTQRQLFKQEREIIIRISETDVSKYSRLQN